MELFNKNTNTNNLNKKGGLRQIYEAIKPQLNLSADQETKIEQTLNELKAKREDFKRGNGGNKEEMQTARQQARQKIKEILNPDQQHIWHENMQKWKEQSE